VTEADRRPLAGRRIVITRARAQAAEFAVQLEALGAEVVEFPVIRIAPPPDPGPLRDAAARAGTFDWIVFTSANGVERFWYALQEQGCDARSLCGVRVCAIGPATAAELERRGVRPELVPDEFVAESAVQALLAAGPVHGARILLPRAEVARAVLPDALRAAGARVEEVTAYTTVRDGAGAERVRAMLARGEVDAVTFTASSTVKNFVDLVGADLGAARVASIGPVTSATARELGLAVDVEAAEYTTPGLARALRDFYAAAE
jgi:uroporphyrinogen III methyltransferase/synthase